MDFQKMFDAMCDAARLSRANYHLTLGKLREMGEQYPDARFVLLGGDFTEGVARSIGRPNSYRGYYADCAFEEISETMRGKDIVEMCDFISDTTFTGYKGGEFRYGPETPLWLAYWGDTGLAITSAMGLPVHPDDGGMVVVLETREID